MTRTLVKNPKSKIFLYRFNHIVTKNSTLCTSGDVPEYCCEKACHGSDVSDKMSPLQIVKVFAECCVTVLFSVQSGR